MRTRQQDHRFDVIGVHVRQYVRRNPGKRIRFGMLVVACVHPSHHAKSTHIIDVDGLQPEKAEVGEVDPVPAIFVARKIQLSNLRKLVFPDRLGATDKRRPGSPERVAIRAFLRHKQAASWIGLQVLCMHGHIAD